MTPLPSIPVAAPTRRVRSGLEVLLATGCGLTAAVSLLVLAGWAWDIERLKSVRERRPGQAIIAISGWAETAILDALAKLKPPVEFMAKPIAVEKILLTLRRLIERPADRPE